MDIVNTRAKTLDERLHEFEQNLGHEKEAHHETNCKLIVMQDSYNDKLTRIDKLEQEVLSTKGQRDDLEKLYGRLQLEHDLLQQQHTTADKELKDCMLKLTMASKARQIMDDLYQKERDKSGDLEEAYKNCTSSIPSRTKRKKNCRRRPPSWNAKWTSSRTE